MRRNYCAADVSGGVQLVRQRSDAPCVFNQTWGYANGQDMWEHAYYLQYENAKGDWVNAFWKVVNWDDVSTATAIDGVGGSRLPRRIPSG